MLRSLIRSFDVHDVAHIPAQHEWSVHALHTWFASPAELTLLDALCGTFDVWNTQHPDASYMQYQITDDRITSVAMTPIKTRLLNISSSGAVRAIAACEHALADYGALEQQDDALRDALRARCGLPLISAQHWIAPEPNQFDDNLATLLN